AAEQENLARKNEAVDAEAARQAAQQKRIQDAAGDKGFEDSLKLYKSMQGKQVKQIFMGLPDDTVVRYLEAMEPRNASKIIREFKTPGERQGINRLRERRRQGEVAAAATQPATGPGGAGVAATDNLEAAGGKQPK